MTFKSGRGGSRLGAGRPKGSMIDPKEKRRSFAVKLPPWLIAWLKQKTGSQGRLIEKALIEYYKLTPPTNKQTEEQYPAGDKE